jgi:uncharacterized protein YjbJ (UPF0337 family)
MGSFVIV